MSWLLGIATPPVDDRGREIVDPAEAWESPVPSSTVARFAPAARVGRIVAPSSDTDLPPGVLRTLRFTCGSLPLDRALIVPASSRPIDRTCRRWVAARKQVLGLGERGTGLWVEGRGRDPAVVVPVERIGAIEDLTVLCYRRISVRAADARLTVRYAADSRALLASPLAWLRRRIAGDACGQVPWQGVRSTGTGPVPESWRAIADVVAGEAGERGAAMVFGVAPSRSDDGSQRGALVAITAAELIVLAQSDSGEARAGTWPQLLVMPRRTLQEARDEEDRLALRSAGVDRILRLGPSLTAAAAELIRCAGPVASELGVTR